MKAEILGTQNNKTQTKVHLEKEMKGNRKMVLQLKRTCKEKLWPLCTLYCKTEIIKGKPFTMRVIQVLSHRARFGRIANKKRG